MGNLGALYTRRWEIAHRARHLDRAVALFEQAAEAAPPHSVDRAAQRVNQALFLAVRYDRSRRPADAAAALAATADAEATGSASAANRVTALVVDGDVHAMMGAWPDAAVAYRRAVEHLPQAAWLGINLDSQLAQLGRWTALLGTAAAALQTGAGGGRAYRRGAGAGGTVVAAAGPARSGPPPAEHRTRRPGTPPRRAPTRTGRIRRLVMTAGDPVYAARLLNLDVNVESRWERDHDPGDLDEAIDLYWKAAAANADVTASCLVNLCHALRMRHRLTGVPADLDAAVAAGAACLDRTAHDDDRRADRLEQAAHARRERYEQAHDLADLEAALGLYREAAQRSDPPTDVEPTGRALVHLRNYYLTVREHHTATGDIRSGNAAVATAFRLAGDPHATGPVQWAARLATKGADPDGPRRSGRKCGATRSPPTTPAGYASPKYAPATSSAPQRHRCTP
jgi:tetratricopeptide (TPR) repeat protein